MPTYAMLDIQDQRAVCTECGLEWELPLDLNDMAEMQRLTLDQVVHFVDVHHEPYYATALLLMQSTSYLDPLSGSEAVLLVAEHVVDELAEMSGGLRADELYAVSFTNDEVRRRDA